MTTETEDKEAQPEGRDPKEWMAYWTKQFVLARKVLRKYQKDGDTINDRFLGKPYTDDEIGLCETQLNLFHANVTTIQSMLFGQLPKVEIDRTFADANDDVARVASEMATRMLNQDIQQAGEDYATTLRSVLQDRLIPGYGTARVVYDFLEEEQVTEAVMGDDGVTELAPEVREMKITHEWVDEVYVHWKDKLWSPCRTFSELRWQAYRSYMDLEKLKKRFGEELAKTIPLNSKGPTNARDGRKQDNSSDLQPEAEVWEIWNKPTRTVFWIVEGMDKILEEKEDYLELDGFWPEPPPMIANLTTSEFLPRADYCLAQDLYREIDELETRITLLTRACKAVGVYDKSSTEIARMLNEGVENQLIPAENWAKFAEKGGIEGSIDWLPIKEIAETIQILTERQANRIQQLYEVTGIADVIRGASQPYEAAATTKTKAQFASIKIQALQEEFARFASDLQSLKFEIIQKHFQEDCIIYQSNIEQSMDATAQPELIPQAIALLKDREKAKWRIRIRPETLAMADYAQLKVDRGEYITALATFMQSAAPLAELDSDVTPVLLQLLQWGLAGFKGSQQIEGVLDRAIAMYQDKAKQPKGPDPEQQKIQAKMQELQMKAQMDQQEMQAKLQMDREKHQMEMQQDQMKFQQEMRQQQQEFQLRMMEMQTEFKIKMTQMSAEVQAKRAEQQAQMEYNTAEREHELAVNKEQAQLDQETAREQAKISTDSARQQAAIKNKGNGKDA